MAITTQRHQIRTVLETQEEQKQDETARGPESSFQGGTMGVKKSSIGSTASVPQSTKSRDEKAELMKTLSITPSQLERMTEQELYQQHIQPWMPVLDRQLL